MKIATSKCFGEYSSSLPDSAGTNQEKSFNIMQLRIDFVRLRTRKTRAGIQPYVERIPMPDESN
jgi:hypothetical protein